jgi:PAS domain S-box-containing protein
VPELLDRREQDRKRLVELEQRLREAEMERARLVAAEGLARERAEHEARARAEFAAAESVRIRELQLRIRDLETAQRQAAAAESAARGEAAESRASMARLAALEARIDELQTARARAQMAANDAERAFAAQPTPTWIVDASSGLVHAASDAAAALVGVEAQALRGKSFNDVVPGVEFADDAVRDARVGWRREDGSMSQLELRRVATSYAGRTCWLVTARDVTAELEGQAQAAQLSTRAAALEAAPEPCGLVDAEGQLHHANRALRALLGLEVDFAPVSLRTLEPEAGADATLRDISSGQDTLRSETRWRRADGTLLDVELAAAPSSDDGRWRSIVVHDVTTARRIARRNEREQQCTSRLLELAQRAHALTEVELIDQSVELAQSATDSPLACVFLSTGDAAAAVELVAHRGDGATDTSLSVLTRWRGVPPADSALFECLATQRAVVRDATEGTGVLHQAGLPGALHRQLAAPLMEGGRLVGALLVANAATPYDDDHRRHLAQVGEVLARLLRRRRSDSEVVSAMDHMERVMFGAIESLAQLAEAQDACKTGRSRRVADYAAGIGKALGLPGHTLRGLRVMGQLIDVGMLQIPRELLWRPGALTAAEYELVKSHADRGAEALRGIEFPWPVAEVVRQHHERLDGSGYPRGLKGDEILLEARIVAVADAVEAMLAQRPHRAALSVAACIDELQSQAGRRYDAKAVKACVKLLRDAQAASAQTTAQEGEAPAGQRIA